MRFKAAVDIILSFGMMFLSVAVANAQPINLVGFGDSLMAGYELPADAAFPARLEKLLRDRGHDVSITNAGVSGDTTADGLARLDWSVPDGTRGVILELGANDALRGLSPEESRANLDAILARLKARGISVLLAGMVAPPNMGSDYAVKFNPIYRELADKYHVPLYPFILDGVATRSELQLKDRMHPNSEGTKVMAENILPVVEGFLKSFAQ